MFGDPAKTRLNVTKIDVIVCLCVVSLGLLGVCMMAYDYWRHNLSAIDRQAIHSELATAQRQRENYRVRIEALEKRPCGLESKP